MIAGVNMAHVRYNHKAITHDVPRFHNSGSTALSKFLDRTIVPTVIVRT